MTGQDIITQFELQVDDGTELSTAEELIILNRVYQHLCANRPWEFTKKEGSLTTSTTLPYVALPTDFLYFVANNNYDGNDTYGATPVVFSGVNFDPINIIPFSDRNRYRNASNYAYLDFANQRLVFNLQPTAANTITFDYHANPADLTLLTSPVFPTAFQPALVYGMAVEDFVLQLSDKARTYQPENQAKYREYVDDLASWNLNIANL